MKCDRCGLQSDVEQAFSTEKHLLRRSRHYCPDCTVKRHALFFIMQFAILGGCGLLLFVLNPLSNIARFYLQGAFIILLMLPLILLHELAHAGVAWLVGLRVFGIMIGIGRTIWHGKFLGVEWALNILPIGGITSVGARPVRNIRGKLFLIYLAGPASHLLIALVCQLLLQTQAISLLVYQLLKTLIFANVLFAVVNLFPRKVSAMTGAQGTDGWHLLRTPSLSDSELAKQYTGCLAAEALRAYGRNDLQAARQWVDKALALDGKSGIAHNVLGIIQMAQRDYQASRSTFVGLLETDDAQEPGLRYIRLNNIAYVDALLRDPSLLPEADEFSAEALKHLPWVPAIIGTRGTVLVELGRLDEGIALLKKSMAMHAEKQGKALNACHLAIGESQRGNLSAAHKYLATAKTLDPDCFLIRDVEAQSERARMPP